MKTADNPVPTWPLATAHCLLPTALRVSFYTSMALASLCLVWAEFAFLPWMIYAWPLLAGVMVLAYWREGEWILSARAANLLGFGIAVGAVTWLVGHYWLSAEGLAADIPWPASMLPHLGPLLVVLMLVKLFRPKTIPDVWVTQGLGLMMVTLGCVLTGAAAFGLLLAVYLASACWCLAVFFLCREQLPLQTSSLLQPFDQPRHLPWRWLGLAPVLRWAASVLVVAFLLFLLVPRQSHKQWDPGLLSTALSPMFATAGDDTIDLTRQGPIELGEGVAFTVTVTDARGPKEDLPAGQRWRGPTLDYYSRGRWLPWQKQHDPREALFQTGQAIPTAFRTNLILPYLGAEQYFIDFHLLPRLAGMLVLAEPVALGAEAGIHPYRNLEVKSQRGNFFFEIQGNSTLVPVPQPRRPEYRYRQVVLPAGDECRPAGLLSHDYVRYLLAQAVPAPLATRARTLLPSLPGLGGVAGLLDDQGKVPGMHWGKSAQALCRHLAQSGQYAYSLEQPRQDLQADPTVDFLLNVRSGHCSRFAGGLTLLLRSLGIPARVIKGYQGAEHQGEGHYVVRQNQAHSWVEVLVPYDQIPGQLNWLTLDPTPAASDTAPYAWSQWLWDSWQDGRVLWQNMVLDYGGEQQAGLVETVWQSLQDPHLWGWVGQVLRLLGYLAGGGVLVLSALLLWRRRQRRPLAAAAAPVFFHVRLLGVLAQRCRLRPQPAQTPREFAQAASAILGSIPAAAPLANLPFQAADCLYRLRYGGQQLAPAEEQDLLRKIQELDSALQE